MLSWFLHRRQDNFIVTGQLASVYRDSAVKAVLSGREYSRPSTGTLQKPRHRLTQTATNPTCRAVSCKANLPYILILPGLPTHKQEFCSSSLQPSLRCKTHALLPTRTPSSSLFYHTMTTPARLPGLQKNKNVSCNST